MKRVLAVLSLLVAGNVAAARAQVVTPDWCKAEPRAAFKSLERLPSADPWFEVYKVAPDTFAIYEPHQWEEAIMYLVVGQERALLVDTGMGIGDLRKVVRGLTRLPVSVVNTHTHNDHVGDNWQFGSVYGLDTAYTRHHAAGSPDYANAVKEEIVPGALCGALPKTFDAAKYETQPWHVDEWLDDGDVIDLGGRTLEVMATPGHAPDSLCLFDRDNGLLFTGDTYYPAGRIFLFDPGTDRAAYGKTVNRLARLAPRVKLVLGGHNEPVASPTVLPALAQAYAAVQSGRIAAEPGGDGMSLYQTAGFRFLLAQPHKSATELAKAQ